MDKRAKRWVAIAALVAVIGGVAIYLNPKQEKKNEQNVKQEPTKRRVEKVLSVEATIIKPTQLTDHISSVGNILPDEKVDLTFETSGKVVNILFKEGREVKRGDLLAKINDATLVADLKRLEAQLPLLNSKLYRQKMLLAKEAISQEAYDIATTDLAKLNAEIESVKASIALTELRAPFNGVVGLRNISEGAFATTGTSLATLTKTKPIKIEFSYPERFSNQIKKGTQIKFSTDEILEPLDAIVYAIEPVVTDGIKTQRARAIYHNNNGLLTAGRYVDINITLDSRDDALVVPSEAMIAEIGKNIIYNYNGGKAKPINVETGIRNEAVVEILKGVQVGDTILTSGLMQLRPDMAVKIKNLK